MILQASSLVFSLAILQTAVEGIQAEGELLPDLNQNLAQRSRDLSKGYLPHVVPYQWMDRRRHGLYTVESPPRSNVYLKEYKWMDRRRGPKSFNRVLSHSTPKPLTTVNPRKWTATEDVGELQKIYIHPFVKAYLKHARGDSFGVHKSTENIPQNNNDGLSVSVDVLVNTKAPEGGRRAQDLLQGRTNPGTNSMRRSDAMSGSGRDNDLDVNLEQVSSGDGEVPDPVGSHGTSKTKDDKVDREPRTKGDKVDREPRTKGDKVDREPRTKGDKVDREPRTKGDKVDREPRTKGDKVDREPRTKGDKVDREPRTKDDKVDREPRTKNDKVDREPRTKDDKVDREPRTKGDKVDREPRTKDDKVDREPRTKDDKVEVFMTKLQHFLLNKKSALWEFKPESRQQLKTLIKSHLLR